MASCLLIAYLLFYAHESYITDSLRENIQRRRKTQRDLGAYHLQKPPGWIWWMPYA